MPLTSQATADTGATAGDAATSMTIGGGELSLLPAASRDASGVISVGAGASGYVAYGPYASVSSGTYLVQFFGATDAESPPGSWELFSGGDILLQRPILPYDATVARLENISQLEVRLHADGGAFRFDRVELTALEESAGVLAEQVRALAAGGFADVASEIVVQVALGGRTDVAADLAAIVTSQPGTGGARSEAALKLVHVRGMARVLDAIAPRYEPRPAPKVVEARLIDVSRGDAEPLRAEGLRPDAVLAVARDSLSDDIAAARELGAGSAEALAELESIAAAYEAPVFRSELLRGCMGLELGFQTTALKLGRIFARSLWTGERLASAHSFVLQVNYSKQPYMFCRFEDVEPWYLMVGTWRGCKNCIYIPGRDLVIALRDRAYDWGNLQDWIGAFKALLLSAPALSNAYLDRETAPAVYGGGINNLGHFFWNDVQGLANARDKGLLANVGVAVLHQYQFLPLPELFPELARMEMLAPKTTEEVFLAVIERGLFCIRPTAVVMTASTAKLVRETAARLASPEQKQLIESAQASDLTVWFNLRAHNKIWLNQEESALQIARKLTGSSKTLTLVLDGTPDCADRVRTITAQLPAGVKVIDATNISLADSIVWAGAVDAYVATIGSGLTLTTWIAGKPGVAHSETSHIGQMDFWPEVQPSAPVPLSPKLGEIRDVGAGMYCNYEIDPRIIATLLMRTIRNKKPAAFDAG